MWWKTDGHRDLYRLLLLWWDPIGVMDVPEAQDEYSGYSGTVGRMLYEGATEQELAAFLGGAEGNMGMQPPNAEPNTLVATKLLDWYGEAMRER